MEYVVIRRTTEAIRKFSGTDTRYRTTGTSHSHWRAAYSGIQGPIAADTRKRRHSTPSLSGRPPWNVLLPTALSPQRVKRWNIPPISPTRNQNQKSSILQRSKVLYFGGWKSRQTIKNACELGFKTGCCAVPITRKAHNTASCCCLLNSNEKRAREPGGPRWARIFFLILTFF